MTRDILISIVIPVYNVEKYLEECLESAVNQTFKSIEIIAVNDGSTDSSLAVLKKYAHKYNNVQIINQENRGLSGARNVGLAHIKGKYVYFLDSDDYIDLNMIKECYELAENNDLDIINFDAEVFYDRDVKSDFKPDYNRSNILESIVYKGEDFYKYAVSRNAYKSSVCLCFYKADFLREFNFKFYEGITHEDELFSAKAFLLANRVMYYPKPYFYRRVREGSIMTQGKSIKNIEGYLTVANELAKLRKIIDNQETENVLNKQILNFYDACLRLTILIFDDNKELMIQIRRIKKNILNNYHLIELNKNLLVKLTFPKFYAYCIKRKVYINQQ